MPLKLVPPRKGKSPNWTIRGTHIGVYVDRSAKTPRRSVAARQLRELESKIERGEFPEKRPEPNAPTFLSAALAYMQAGRSRRGLAALIDHFGETPLVEINQRAIDAAAIAIKPDVTPATRNTYVYTPISAVMHYALGDDAPKTAVQRGPKVASSLISFHLLTHLRLSRSRRIISSLRCYCGFYSTAAPGLVRRYRFTGPKSHSKSASPASARRKTTTHGQFGFGQTFAQS